MSKVTLVAGLPGSGKTWLARVLAEESGAELFDDIDTPDIPRLKEVIGKGLDAVITDPRLCDPNTLQTAQGMLKHLGAEVEVICFENDPEACLANVERRNDGRKVEDFIATFSKLYVIPEGVQVRPVWRGSLSGAEV